jgi:hypothetical protein
VAGAAHEKELTGNARRGVHGATHSHWDDTVPLPMNDPRRNAELGDFRPRIEVNAGDHAPQQRDRRQGPARHLARGRERRLENQHGGRMLGGELRRDGAAERVAVERDARGVDAELLAGESIGRARVALR